MDVPEILEAIHVKELFSDVISHGTGLEVSIKPEKDGKGFILKIIPLSQEKSREETKAAPDRTQHSEVQNEFHSGKKLGLFRKIRGLCQTEVLAQANFPNSQMDTRSLRKWEKDGVPKAHLAAVAQACGYESWVFLDNRISPGQFERITLHPDLQEKMRRELYAISV